MGSPVSGRGGVDFSRIDSVQEFPLGLVEGDTDGGAWVYFEAGAALTAYLAYKVLPTGKVGSSTAKDNSVDDNAASFTGGFPVCWPQQAFADGKFGWARVSGEFEATTANGVGAAAQLYTSTTAGVLGGTASAHFNIIGEAVAVDANATGADATVTIRVTPTQPAFVQAVANA